MNVPTLPMIYHLRNVIQIGTTLVQWSATQSNVTDCTFGVWYGAESPVETNRTPDTTVWYSGSMSEYSTTFSQREPCYVAIAAINETETGFQAILFQLLFNSEFF